MTIKKLAWAGKVQRETIEPHRDLDHNAAAGRDQLGHGPQRLVSEHGLSASVASPVGGGQPAEETAPAGLGGWGGARPAGEPGSEALIDYGRLGRWTDRSPAGR